MDTEAAGWAVVAAQPGMDPKGRVPGLVAAFLEPSPALRLRPLLCPTAGAGGGGPRVFLLPTGGPPGQVPAPGPRAPLRPGLAPAAQDQHAGEGASRRDPRLTQPPHPKAGCLPSREKGCCGLQLKPGATGTAATPTSLPRTPQRGSSTCVRASLGERRRGSLSGTASLGGREDL